MPGPECRAVRAASRVLVSAAPGLNQTSELEWRASSGSSLVGLIRR